MLDSLKIEIEDSLNLKLKEFKTCQGGDINESYLLVFDDGTKAFLKTHASPPNNFFSAEAAGLEELRKTEATIIPRVFQVSESYLLLEYLEPAQKSEGAEMLLGASLAAVHQNHSSTHGFFQNNFCGLTLQKNTRTLKFSEFFLEHRLEAQAELAKDKGWWSDQDKGAFEGIKDKIKALLDEGPQQASLVHGDLWSGNVLWTAKGPALIDPAVYYGSHEVDLAFTELFGGFGAKFYNGYKGLFPLKPGYEKRKTILNLYHLFNHANLFAGAYKQRVRASLQEIAAL